MVRCSSCGIENRVGARFCDGCGAALAAAAPGREQRKTVTVLFCDVTGSTALGESVDPEALRAVLARYFERMKGIVEAHGGSVEKFVGDAVMAVFGVPLVREDDALRACRAAVEMREALPGLGVGARIGVNTGEVVTGTAERLVTGDAVNVAARLEQAAAVGEVLVGEATLRLVRALVEVEPVEPLSLKGKSEPVPAFRLLSVEGVVEPRFAAPMVGRETELERLRGAFRQAVRDRSCQLFTVLGSAGVGKSRLAAEFAAGIEARVVLGRCLSYGEGITYGPVVEVLKQLDALKADAAAAAPLRSLLGETAGGASPEEIAWGFRKLLEQEAQQRPLVCVLDDLHWGEETLLDLVEHLADLSRDAPLLLLCIARPDLLERRPAWGGGKWNATTVLLEPLDDAETDELIAALGGTGEVGARVRQASEGNPLFVEEMLALVRESGDGEVRVPPTIQALLAARLDQLDPAERDVLERGAVEGQVFHRSAVAALTNDDRELDGSFVSLVRKQLVRPHRSQVAGDEAYRFRHLLIRDAAYEGLPKARRAELHQRCAAWLEERVPDLVELDELVGYHLEQAARCKRELGQPDPVLAERAGERLAAAGRRAFRRGDLRAGTSLVERALELLRPLRLDVELELVLASAEVEPRRAAEIAEAAAERAHAESDWAGEALARCVAASRLNFEPGYGVDELEALAEKAIVLLEEAGDDAGLAHAWAARGVAAGGVRGQMEEWAHAAEQALRHARIAGARPTHLFGLDIALALGPRPADEALHTLDALLPEIPHPRITLSRSWLLAMLGRFEEASPLARQAHERLREWTGASSGDDVLATIATLAGDHEAAAQSWRRTCDELQARGESGVLSTAAPTLARSLCALGRDDEAERWAQLGRELGAEHDIATQALWRQAQALVEASRGRLAEAESLAREAVAITQETDMLNWQGNALCDLAEVLTVARRDHDAAAALEQALKRYERKRNVAMAAQVRARLSALRGREPESEPALP